MFDRFWRIEGELVILAQCSLMLPPKSRLVVVRNRTRSFSVGLNRKLVSEQLSSLIPQLAMIFAQFSSNNCVPAIQTRQFINASRAVFRSAQQELPSARSDGRRI